jgi:biotin synthase
VTRREALALAAARGAALEAVLDRADACRRAHFGDRVSLCSIVAARRGGCGEDCAFCAQSARYATHVPAEPMMAPEAILRAAREVEACGVSHFGIVTSGRSLSAADFRAALSAVELVAARTRLTPCAALGALDAGRARALVNAGCRRYNHNLETSERMFPRLCTTHTFADRLSTVEAARAAGLEVCCGGIIGIGETLEDRVDLALRLRDLGPAVVPLNVLMPVAGTPLAEASPLEPLEVLATLAMFRLVNPASTLKLAAGRDRGLRSLNSWVFRAGANALMVGNYLTQTGRPVADDLAMLDDLGLTVAPAEAPLAGGDTDVRGN